MAVSQGRPVTWNEITWNPPVYSPASGAYIADRNGDGWVDRQNFSRSDEDDRESADVRTVSSGAENYAMRRARKGVIFQYLQYPDKDWKAQEVDGYEESSALDGNRYGFRFHYNPSTIEYGIGVNGLNINPAIIFSGQDSAVPLTPPGDGANSAVIRFQIYLNRMEDMQFLSKRQDGSTVFRPPTGDEIRNFYGTGQAINVGDCRHIFNRGTGYDLEFLFRTMLGRPWRTLLRKKTADVGIAFGVPLVVDFSAGDSPMAMNHGQRYLGRVSAVSYNHLSFTPNMVPMWTQVAIDFVRYPDVLAKPTGASQAALQAWGDRYTGLANRDYGALTGAQQAQADRLTALANEDYGVLTAAQQAVADRYASQANNPVTQPWSPWPGVFGPSYNDPLGGNR